MCVSRFTRTVNVAIFTILPVPSHALQLTNGLVCVIRKKMFGKHRVRVAISPKCQPCIRMHYTQIIYYFVWKMRWVQVKIHLIASVPKVPGGSRKVLEESVRMGTTARAYPIYLGTYSDELRKKRPNNSNFRNKVLRVYRGKVI